MTLVDLILRTRTRLVKHVIVSSVKAGKLTKSIPILAIFHSEIIRDFLEKAPFKKPPEHP